MESAASWCFGCIILTVHIFTLLLTICHNLNRATSTHTQTHTLAFIRHHNHRRENVSCKYSGTLARRTYTNTHNNTHSSKRTQNVHFGLSTFSILSQIIIKQFRQMIFPILLCVCCILTCMRVLCMDVGLLGLNKQPGKQNEMQLKPANKNLLTTNTYDMVYVYVVHSTYNIVSTVLLLPCSCSLFTVHAHEYGAHTTYIQHTHTHTRYYYITFLLKLCTLSPAISSNMQIHFLRNIAKPMMLIVFPKSVSTVLPFICIHTEGVSAATRAEQSRTAAAAAATANRTEIEREIIVYTISTLITKHPKEFP